MPDIEIPCVQCKEVFTFTEKEQELFYLKNMMAPQRCQKCRSKKAATGENAPESEFGRVYVQGLTDTNDPKIALLFDKLPTPGGDHCHGLRRIWTPLAREVFTISGSREVIWERDWPAHTKAQIQLLVAAGISREQADRYYTEKPEKAVYKSNGRTP